VTATPVRGLVSVIVASYNHAKFLPARIEGLLQQSYLNVEILVIDDGSPDDSVSVLRRYADAPNLVLIEREVNGGWVTVSNQGVALARGEFVIFANCDDDCDPQLIARLVDAMNRHPSVGVVFCRSTLIDEMGQSIGDDYGIRERAFRERCVTDVLLPAREITQFLFDSCVIPNLSAALIRRDCFDEVGLLSHSYRVCCDWDLFFRIFSRYDAYRTTIRSRTKDRVVYAEYLRLLLPQVHLASVTLGERMRARRKIMAIWALHIISPSASGMLDFPYHARLVNSHDAVAFLLLPIAVGERIVQLFMKLFARRSPAVVA
jgi:glycosyltransferase involved in cell wall biosynthesis